MSLPEQKYCPRCHVAFECKMENIQECQCSAITLTEEEREFIGKEYEDCLCARCLLEIVREKRF